MFKVQILTMMSNVLDFIHQASKSGVINLQFEFDINNAYQQCLFSKCRNGLSFQATSYIFSLMLSDII